ncbi:2-oxoglutarate dehydrogenase E1 [Paenibacillus agaridevorans]|uniref:2-oxoglutarate dehydrogenase E1 n=1 Tax=Paenibacillus agaridevorans TaxID=171404 RepID=A0A2R5F094_9BACL|nr:2-oxoglutarate dehydrogenase E1 [Paenibacillus agaridevorans]
MIRNEPIKAITIWQPWATLITLRLKGFETRSRRTHYRGPIAIHAAKHIDLAACREEPIRSELLEYGYTSDNLPTGAVIATAVLSDCIKSVDTWTDGYILENGVYVYSPEYEYGDFTPGRYAWEMREVYELPKPIPAKGQQGLWNWDGGFI